MRDEDWAVILHMKTVFGSLTNQLNLNKTIYVWRNKSLLHLNKMFRMERESD